MVYTFMKYVIGFIFGVLATLAYSAGLFNVNFALAQTVPITDLTQFQRISANQNTGVSNRTANQTIPLIISTSTVASVVNSGQTFQSLSWRSGVTSGEHFDSFTSNWNLSVVQNGSVLFSYAVSDYCLTQGNTNSFSARCNHVPIPFYTQFDPNYAIHIFAFDGSTPTGGFVYRSASCGDDFVQIARDGVYECVNRLLITTVPVFQVTVGTSTSSGGGSGTIIINSMTGTTTCETTGDETECFYLQSTSSPPLQVTSHDLIFILGVIIFILALGLIGLVANSVLTSIKLKNRQ